LKSEYLVFNIIVLSGPLFFGSLQRFYFWNYWKQAVVSVLISAVPFLFWDISVTGRHWFFADEYTLGFRILNLPFEEILFFITVPFACLFTWEMVKRHSNPPIFKNLNLGRTSTTYIIILFLVAAIISINSGKEYTFLASLFFIASILYDRIWGAGIIYSDKFPFFFILISFFTLLFNGYLTWRPVVTYDVIYQLDFRIFTIPVEDFFFGYALLIFCTSIFEKMISNKN